MPAHLKLFIEAGFPSDILVLFGEFFDSVIDCRCIDPGGIEGLQEEHSCCLHSHFLAMEFMVYLQHQKEEFYFDW